MELPKNITQIGESDQHCKIYVEDYVVSYMKQLNSLAADKEMAVALYGVRKEENGISYLFLYGACKVNFLQRDTRHLSQAQQQEIERFRKKYFKEYTFLAYRLLNGEMIEGFHVCEQGICRYISGFSQFYEKNDSMLAYMLDVRQEVQPETVNQEKYEIARKHQEERRTIHEETQKGRVKTSAKAAGNPRKIKGTTVAVFAMLCVIGLAAMNREGSLDELQTLAGQMLEGAMQQKIPDAVEVSNADVQVDTLIAEDKLTEAVRKENEGTEVAEEELAEQQVTENSSVNTSAQNADTQNAGTENANTQDTEAGNANMQNTGTENTNTENADAENADAENVDAQNPVAEPTSYTIRQGDTLIGISVRNYGSDSKVSEICSLNQITNPDDIKVGQKILLP